MSWDQSACPQIRSKGVDFRHSRVLLEHLPKRPVERRTPGSAVSGELLVTAFSARVGLQV